MAREQTAVNDQNNDISFTVALKALGHESWATRAALPILVHRSFHMRKAICDDKRTGESRADNCRQSHQTHAHMLLATHRCLAQLTMRASLRRETQATGNKTKMQDVPSLRLTPGLSLYVAAKLLLLGPAASGKVPRPI
eukprot:3684267-Alexandrium_andersonii.AAC.1